MAFKDTAPSDAFLGLLYLNYDLLFFCLSVCLYQPEGLDWISYAFKRVFKIWRVILDAYFQSIGGDFDWKNVRLLNIGR